MSGYDDDLTWSENDDDPYDSVYGHDGWQPTAWERDQMDQMDQMERALPQYAAEQWRLRNQAAYDQEVELTRKIDLEQLDSLIEQSERSLEQIQKRLARSPGDNLDRFVRSRFSQMSYKRVFSQIMIDMRIEYAEALSEGNRGKAWLIVVRCYGSVLWASMIHVLNGVLASVIQRLGS